MPLVHAKMVARVSTVLLSTRASVREASPESTAHGVSKSMFVLPFFNKRVCVCVLVQRRVEMHRL